MPCEDPPNFDAATIALDMKRQFRHPGCGEYWIKVEAGTAPVPANVTFPPAAGWNRGRHIRTEHTAAGNTNYIINQQQGQQQQNLRNVCFFSDGDHWIDVPCHSISCPTGILKPPVDQCRSCPENNRSLQDPVWWSFSDWLSGSFDAGCDNFVLRPRNGYWRANLTFPPAENHSYKYIKINQETTYRTDYTINKGDPVLTIADSFTTAENHYYISNKIKWIKITCTNFTNCHGRTEIMLYCDGQNHTLIQHYDVAKCGAGVTPSWQQTMEPSTCGYGPEPSVARLASESSGTITLEVTRNGEAGRVTTTNHDAINALKTGSHWQTEDIADSWNASGRSSFCFNASGCNPQDTGRVSRWPDMYFDCDQTCTRWTATNGEQFFGRAAGTGTTPGTKYFPILHGTNDPSVHSSVRTANPTNLRGMTSSSTWLSMPGLCTCHSGGSCNVTTCFPGWDLDNTSCVECNVSHAIGYDDVGGIARPTCGVRECNVSWKPSDSQDECVPCNVSHAVKYEEVDGIEIPSCGVETCNVSWKPSDSQDECVPCNVSHVVKYEEVNGIEIPSCGVEACEISFKPSPDETSCVDCGIPNATEYKLVDAAIPSSCGVKACDIGMKPNDAETACVPCDIAHAIEYTLVHVAVPPSCGVQECDQTFDVNADATACVPCTVPHDIKWVALFDFNTCNIKICSFGYRLVAGENRCEPVPTFPTPYPTQQPTFVPTAVPTSEPTEEPAIIARAFTPEEDLFNYLWLLLLLIPYCLLLLLLLRRRRTEPKAKQKHQYFAADRNMMHNTALLGIMTDDQTSQHNSDFDFSGSPSSQEEDSDSHSSDASSQQSGHQLISSSATESSTVTSVTLPNLIWSLMIMIRKLSTSNYAICKEL